MGRNLFHYFLRPVLSGEGGRPIISISSLSLLLHFHCCYHHYHPGLLDRDGGPEPCRGSQLYGTIGTGVAYLSPYLLQYLSPCEPQYLLPYLAIAQTCDPISLGCPSNTHRYIFVLLNVFSLLPTQSPVGGEVGVAGEKKLKTQTGYDMQYKTTVFRLFTCRG